MTEQKFEGVTNSFAEEEIFRLRQELAETRQSVAELKALLTRQNHELVYWRPIRHWLDHIARWAWLITPKIGRLAHYRPRLLELPEAQTLDIAFTAPRISIVTPSFQQAAYLPFTLESVLGQNYPNLEYFIQDGASTDDTLQLLQAYDQRLTGRASSPDAGQAQAIMAWLNSDDLLLPGALARVAEFFATHPNIDVVYGHRILIDAQNREIGRWILPPHRDKVLSWADFAPQETLFWRRRIWERIGGKLDESFRFAMDWDLLLKFRAAGARMVRLPYFLGAFRIHEAQKTSALMEEVGASEMALLRQRSLQRAVTRYQIRRALIPYLSMHLLLDFHWRLKRRFRKNVTLVQQPVDP
jgi:carbamoyltransferase